MKQILLFIAVVIFSLKMTAQRQNPWQKIAATTVENQSKVKRTSIVSEFEVFSLDVTTFKNQLLNAPKRVASVGISTQYVYFPDVDGNTTLYRIYEASVMHPELQAQFPEIKSYIGVGVDDKSAVIRFSMTLFGLHAMILSPKGTVIINPYTSDLTTYMVYKKKNAISSSSFECLTTEVEAAEKSSTHFSPRNAYDIESNTGIFRTYRLGLACTEEYSQFHINSAGVASGTVAQRDNAVLSAMNVTMTRVNGIFERDMSLTMVIVPNNANVIFFLPEKPDALTNSNGSSLINEIQPIINTGIGSANYDIGHVFSTGGGGIAQLNSPCGSGKARGVTGQGSPVGDTFDVDYVAHEMGHQFGANHTQNNSCQRNLSTAMEPGSASTIMGYAGICSPNVQNNSDDYFHIVSLTEMDAFVAAAGNCSVNIANNNNAPVVEPIPNYIIPISTAFVLPGNATDADGDTLTYCWEQTNNQISTTQPPVPGNTGGPSFRSLSPSLNPDRYMPRMTTILTGNLSNTPANLWEVVPSVARTMNFALTVRDNELINGGQTTRANMTVTTTESAGPFVVSSPNTNVSWLAGSNQNVTWNVAGTTANGVDSEFVDIYLSTNGGTTFPILLASKVPNDGSETVSMPASTGNQNRIMVRGNNHIFLDVSDTNFTISASSSTFLLSYDGTIDGQNKTVCQGQEATYDLIYSTLGGFSAATTFSVSGNPVGSTATLSPTSLNANGTVQLLLSDTDLVTPGIYQMVVTGTSGATTKTVNIYVEIKSGSFQSIIPVSPVDMASGVTTTVNVSWNTDSNATAYDYEFSSDSTFSTLITSGTVNTNQFFVSGLQNQTNYFWRVLPKNASCAGELSPTFRFTTVNTVVCSPIVNAANVPITISAAGTPTVNSTLTIPTGQNQSIAKITVSLNITHTWMADLTVILISPLGTQIQLFSGQCGSNNNAVATFDDDGNALICLNATPTISGTFIPSQPLSAFIGEDTQGTWILRISDSATGDGGTINSWGITICTLDETPLACGILNSTWNGSSWSNGVPVNNVAAAINGNYTSVGDLECCSLTINNTAQVTIQSGHNLIVSGAVSVANTASFTLENNANLIQLENVQNTGEITVNRATSPLLRLDYVMWSSPVTGSTTLKQFSPSTLDNRFYTYNTVNNVYNSISSPTTVPFEEGKGYLIRMPANHPTTPTSWNGQFSGVPKNGAINIPLTYNSGTQKYNAIGNPYPSTLSAEAFLTSNQADLEGVLYFWRKTNNAAGTAYATYTLGGATTTSPTSPIPNGTIQVGQGFIVAATDVASPTVRFTNDLRVDNTSNQFFRSNFGLPYYTQNQTEMNRIWLNLTNQAGLFSQMMIGYLGNATNEIDELIDGKYIGDSQIALSSLLATEEYVIQGKALPFETTDVVPLVFRTNVSGNFTVSLSAVDGLFEGDQTIFLRDNLTGNVSDLKLGEYSYFTETGIFSNRFEIIYQNSTLSLTENSAENALLVATGKQEIVLKSTIDLIESVLVFDVVGRTLLEIKNIKDQNFTISELTSKQQTLLLKITLNNGKVVTKKIVY